MPRNQAHRLAFGALTAVGLVLVLGVQARSTVAWTGVSGASSSESVAGKVRIHLNGSLSGPQFATVGRGRFAASGAFADRGRFVDEFRGIHPPDEPHVLTLRGGKGTLLIDVERTGAWRITRGTKTYAGLRGRGLLEGRYGFTGIDATMVGAVSDTSPIRLPAVRGRMVIECDAQVVPKRRAFAGRCTISGAITDRGTFVDEDPLRVRPRVRRVQGAKGTLRISVAGEGGRWTIIEGTMAYAGLRGRGQESQSACRGSARCRFHIKMTGSVSR